MAGIKIKKGDRVRVLTGKDRGHEGQVMRVVNRPHPAQSDERLYFELIEQSAPD